MPKPQGQCIYCGGTGLSKEHLFADWLKAYVPRELTKHTTAFTVQWPDRSDTWHESKPGDTHARRLRKVCVDCNRGWMSALQQAAKPHLIPMLEGKATKLSRTAQKTVAAWATMTAMTAEYLNGEMVATPQHERDHLREMAKPPRSWRIWLTRYDGKSMAGRYWHRAMALTHKDVKDINNFALAQSNTLAATIGFGDHLLVHLLGSETGSSYVKRFRFPANIKPNMQQIWPAAAATVEWPPAYTFNKAGVIALADEFYRRVVRQSRSQAGLE